MPYPNSKLAPTARAKCVHCSAKIDKGTLKIEIERTISTAQGDRLGTASLHAGCARAWLDSEAWPGGVAAFALALAGHGELPVPDLAGELGGDAALPVGNRSVLRRKLAGSQRFAPLTPAREIVDLLSAHRWDFKDFTDARMVIYNGPDVIRAFVAKVPPAQKEEHVGWILMELVRHAAEHADRRNELLGMAREVSAELPSISASSWHFLISSAPEEAAELVQSLVTKVSKEARVEALWMVVNFHLAQSWVPSGWRLDAFAIGLDGSEVWNGRRAIDAAVVMGSSELVKSWMGVAAAPLRAPLERVWTWSFGPNEVGDRTISELSLPAGASAAELAAGLVRILREGLARVDAPFIAKKGSRFAKDLAADPGKLERILDERAKLVPIVQARIERYRQVLELLGGTELPPRTTQPAPAATPLPWLVKDLRDCVDDAFDRHLDIQAAFSEKDVVVVEFTRDGEESTASIRWPRPVASNTKKLEELLGAMADAAGD